MRILYAALLVLLTSAASAETVPKSAFDNTCAKPDWLTPRDANDGVMISFRGTASGQLMDVKVVSPSRDPRADDYIVRCISEWRFDPESGAGRLDRGVQVGRFVWDKPDRGHLYHIGKAHNCDRWASANAGVEGITRVSFRITKAGQTADVRLTESSGNAKQDAAAVRCAQTWRYGPARDANGDPVEVTDAADIAWNLTMPAALKREINACAMKVGAQLANYKPTEGFTEFEITTGPYESRTVSLKHTSGDPALDDAMGRCLVTMHDQVETVSINPNIELLNRKTFPVKIVWTQPGK